MVDRTRWLGYTIRRYAYSNRHVKTGNLPRTSGVLWLILTQVAVLFDNRFVGEATQPTTNKKMSTCPEAI